MDQVIVRINGQAVWKVWQDDGSWIAVCDGLRLTAVGDTYGDMVESIADMVEHLLRDFFISGRFVGLMQQHGWTSDNSDAARKDPAHARFDLPMDFRRTTSHEASL